MDNYVTRDMDAHVADRMDAAIAALADAGIAVERISLPELDDLPVLTRTANFSPVEAYAWHARFLKDGRSSEYDPRVLKRIAAGEAMRAHDYVKLLADRRALMRSVAAGVAGLDALLWPTVPIIAPTFDQLAEDEEYHAINMLVLRNSSLVNMLDGCAVSLPCPTEGAPVGLTIAAMNGRDDHLLGVARLVERVLGGGGQVSLNAWLAQG